MAINLLLVPLLHAKEYLGRHHSLIRILEVQIVVNAEGRGILKEMGSDGCMVECALHVVARLVHPEERKDVEYSWVDFSTSIGDDADYDLRRNTEVILGIEERDYMRIEYGVL